MSCTVCFDLGVSSATQIEMIKLLHKHKASPCIKHCTALSMSVYQSLDIIGIIARSRIRLQNKLFPFFDRNNERQNF